MKCKRGDCRGSLNSLISWALDHYLYPFSISFVYFFTFCSLFVSFIWALLIILIIDFHNECFLKCNHEGFCAVGLECPEINNGKWFLEAAKGRAVWQTLTFQKMFCLFCRIYVFALLGWHYQICLMLYPPAGRQFRIFFSIMNGLQKDDFFFFLDNMS